MTRQNNTLSGLLLLATGLIIGATSALFIKEIQPKKPQLILEETKKVFQAQGKITGSWIDYDPVEYNIYNSQPLVYLGGISRLENDEIITYSFVADAYTGEILDIFEYQA